LRIEGKFSLRAGTGSRYPSATYFSDLKVKSLDEPVFTYFRQDDSLWAEEVYDHADLWSAYPSIKNWGCAITSAAMILRFYGHAQMPNGEELNPQTLNQWLKQEVDAYVGDGLLNWLAISRLSKILSEIDGQPKLEFSHFRGSEEELKDKLQAELDKGQPQIVHIPGHFLVVDDFDDDFSVKDPLYDYAFLSEMDSEIDSLRIFTPSYTDLSYLLLVLPKDFEFETEGIKFLQFEEEIIFEDESLGSDFKLYYHQQPNDMEFSLIFNNFDLADAQFFIYQKDGSFQEYDFSELMELDSEQIKAVSLNVSYEKEEASDFSYQLIEKTDSEKLSSFKEELNQFFREAEITFYLYYQINRLLFDIEAGKTAFKYLEKFLHFYDLSFETI
jgi:hypothetical protein